MGGLLADTQTHLVDFLFTRPPSWLLVEASEPSTFLHYQAANHLRGGHHTGVILQGEALEADHWSDLANNYDYYTADSTDAAVMTTSMAMSNSIVNSKVKIVPRAEWS